MIVRLVLRAMSRGKARVACAVLGFAAATGAVVFTTSLAATNAAQAPLLAARAARPWAAWRVEGLSLWGGPGGRPPPSADERPDARPARGALPPGDVRVPLVSLTVDLRPGGHVLQGPPLRALMTCSRGTNLFEAVSLAEGRWVEDDSETCEVVCVRALLRRFGAEAPPLGTELVFVGAHGTMRATLVGYLDGERLPPQFPNVLANKAAFARLAQEEHGTLALCRQAPPPSRPSAWLTPGDECVYGAFRNDEQRRMDYAKPLMLIAAFLTALSLLVNSLLLSLDANRRDLALLRTIGMMRFGAVGFVAIEALVSGVAGWALGVIVSLAGVVLFAHDPVAFPAGAAFDWGRIALTLAALPPVLLVAILVALRPALRVRPLAALGLPPRSRRGGMTLTFALGFGAFVAVEVWGASLMRAFVPSPEWPDAIVSLLPGGVSSFDIDKLRDIQGVRRVSELLPLQVDLSGAEAGAARPRTPGRARPNALFLAAAWLPRFRFVEGDWESAVAGLEAGGVVVTEMMSRARNLHTGDKLLDLPIVGVVRLNWHMVTSRGLVRGLNRMPAMTDGPVFASFDTVESLDRRPAAFVRMTHLWVEYEPGYAESCGGVFEAGRKIEAEIARRLGYPPQATVRLHARDEIADGTLAHGSDIIGAAARVPYVFLAILSVGFIALLVAEADARKRELAILRAVGATRGELGARLAAVALKTALAGMACGVPAGALLGWLATFKTAAIWPGLPHGFVLPVRLILEGALGALVFALVFAVPAALAIVGRLTRRRP